jgi:integrase
MHGCLRAVLNQVWKLVGTIPRKASGCPARKHGSHPVVLAKQDIRRVIEALPEPTKSVVVGSLRIGEVTTLRWERIHSDRIEIVERFYKANSMTRRPMPGAEHPA